MTEPDLVLKTCPWCAMGIPKDALVCPHCRKQQSRRRPGESGAISWVLLLGLIIAFGSLVFWGMQRSSGNGSGDSGYAPLIFGGAVLVVAIVWEILQARR